MQPLILTLRLDGPSQAFFNDMRRRHFPAVLNVLDAHVTLFHNLPRPDEPAIRAELARVASDRAPIAVTVEGLRSLGRGVAYRLASPDLVALRNDLAARWAGSLTPQDSQKFQPHVTVQNKVEPGEARALLDALQAGFQPWPAEGLGLDLWEYQNGPWGFLHHVAFKG